MNDIASGRFGVRPNQLRPLAEQAVNALNVYREVWGLEYPYGQLDLVNSPFQSGSGQSPCSIVYLSSDAFRGDAELAALYGETRFFRTLVAHEVGHQWWGGLINNLNSYNYWFIESLAEYSSALWIEAVSSEGGKDPAKGFREYLKQVEDWRAAVLRSGTTGSVQEADMAAAPAEVGSSRQALVYFKGAFAFHMLRQLIGDQATWKLFRDIGSEFEGKRITTRDIERVAEQSLGRPMGWFFDQWIRGTGLPQYRLQYSTRQSEDGNWVVEGAVQQRLVVGTGNHERVVDGTFLAKVPITVTGKDGKEYANPVYLRDAETPFAFKVPVEPRDVELNKTYDTLAHDPIINEPWDD
jgi:aminopeptidase N